MRAGSRKGGKEGRDQEARIHSSRSASQGGGEGMKGGREGGKEERRAASSLLAELHPVGSSSR